MYFQYDTNGAPLGFIWNGTQYLYMTNQMGDVISITDAQGNELVQYEYDEWGAMASITTTNNTEKENTLANINPLRYRGYYYDNETEYYYLQSRYYDTSICRFINADDYNYVGKDIYNGLNIFSYCCNDPLNYVDYTGQCWWAGPGKIGHDSWEGASKYNASKALNYAYKWYEDRNYSYYDYKSDCANFVSQCLYAGGIKMTSTWYSFMKSKDPNKGKKWDKKHGYYYLVSNNWSLAKNLYNYLKKTQFCKKTVTISSKSGISRATSSKSVKAGDIMFFDWGDGKGISHATIVSKVSTSDIYYAAHSRNRYDYSVKGAYSSKWKIYIISMKTS